MLVVLGIGVPINFIKNVALGIVCNVSKFYMANKNYSYMGNNEWFNSLSRALRI